MVETTGLADPAPVLHALMTSDLVLDRYALNGVVTVVDATAGEATLDRFPEARAQAGVADLLLVSKTDLADAGTADRLRARLGALNPNAPLRDASDAGPDDIFALAAQDVALKAPEVADWLRFEPHGHDHDHDPNRHGSDITAFCFTGAEPVNPWDVQDTIETLQTRSRPRPLAAEGHRLPRRGPGDTRWSCTRSSTSCIRRRGSTAGRTPRARRG